MAQKTIITCAVTGGTAVPRGHPNFPVTPKQIADQALEAARAGASVVHLHVRDPATGEPSGELALYREAVDRIRQGNPDLLINLTTGYGAIFVPEPGKWSVAGRGTNILPAAERVAHVVALKPEICTLDMHTLQIPDIISGDRGASIVVMNLEPVLIEMASLIRGAGVVPEIEVFEAGDLSRAARLIKAGVLEGPGLYTFVLSPSYGLPPTTAGMTLACGSIPADAVWTGMGVGATSFPMAAQSYLMGGHVRVGLEDNIYISRGRYAESNAALVTHVRSILEAMGAEIATTSEARAIIGLRDRTPARVPG